MTAVTQLGAGAILEYVENGWTLTEYGRVGTGQIGGPCGRCHRPCWRYGPAGRAHCNTCQKDN